MQNTKIRNIVIVAHKFLPQPDDDLFLYLNTKVKENVMHITHSFPEMRNRKSRCLHYKTGQICNDTYSWDLYGLPDFIIYVKELIYTFYCVFRSRVKWDLYIGMDGLTVLFGLMLKRLGVVTKVVYWAMDFVPKDRFQGLFGNIKNFIYRKINTVGYTSADEMWDISPRMAQARQDFLDISKDSYKVQRVVPFGVWTSRIKTYPYEECEKTTLVFMGHLLEKQGVQIVLKAIPDIIKLIPDFKFKIIGTGRYETVLKNIAKDSGISEYCVFLGKIDDDITMENEIAKSCVAIAPYIKELDKWTYYADPGKLKKYLACGVPVILTDVPWNANEIQMRECGVISSTEPFELVQKICNLFNGTTNQKFRTNALMYAKLYDYASVFDELFS